MAKAAGDIYVLKAGNGLYKIGRTSNIEARLMQFNIHSPLPLELVFSKRVGNGKQLEDYLHHFFRSRREHGEWFRLSDADLAKLRDIAEAEKVPGRNKGSDKTTVYISPTEAAPLYQLAATLGFVRGGGGEEETG